LAVENENGEMAFDNETGCEGRRWHQLLHCPVWFHAVTICYRVITGKLSMAEHLFTARQNGTEILFI